MTEKEAGDKSRKNQILFELEGRVGTYSRVGAYDFPNIFSKKGQRITKQGITNLFRLDKTKQSAKSNITFWAFRVGTYSRWVLYLKLDSY